MSCGHDFPPLEKPINQRVNYKAVDTSSENLSRNLFAKFRINYSNRMQKLSANHINVDKLKAHIPEPSTENTK